MIREGLVEVDAAAVFANRMMKRIRATVKLRGAGIQMEIRRQDCEEVIRSMERDGIPVGATTALVSPKEAQEIAERAKRKN